MVDRGANGGLAGADMRIIQKNINIVGINVHELTGLGIVTAASLFDTQKGPVIGIFHEYAHSGKGRSVHAAGWNDLSAKWTTDPKLWEVPKGLKPLMDMCSP